MNLVINDHSGATAVWHVSALQFVILAHMQFLVVTEHRVVGYKCHDPSMSVPTSPILVYYTRLVTGYHSGPMAVWHVAALEFVILAPM